MAQAVPGCGAARALNKEIAMNKQLLRVGEAADVLAESRLAVFRGGGGGRVGGPEIGGGGRRVVRPPLCRPG